MLLFGYGFMLLSGVLFDLWVNVVSCLDIVLFVLMFYMYIIEIGLGYDLEGLLSIVGVIVIMLLGLCVGVWLCIG